MFNYYSYEDFPGRRSGISPTETPEEFRPHPLLTVYIRISSACLGGFFTFSCDGFRVLSQHNLHHQLTTASHIPDTIMKGMDVFFKFRTKK
jgi:hypothetical protein